MTHHDKIVIFGQSCVGKTTFAKQLAGHEYCCFDALFPWHLIEAFGLSTSAGLQHVRQHCSEQARFVLDGWHLSDAAGRHLPAAAVYVLYADYDRIIRQYRAPVEYYDIHRHMFRRWYYEIDYQQFPVVRYFENVGEFLERDEHDFRLFQERNR